jgi:4-amino-4-deoxy-L-arabinose transferase-like glycosyltransferase
MLSIFGLLRMFGEKQDVMLNSSQLVLSGSEIVDEVDCSRIEVIPDKKAYESVLFEQFGSVLPLGLHKPHQALPEQRRELDNVISKDMACQENRM